MVRFIIASVLGRLFVKILLRSYVVFTFLLSTVRADTRPFLLGKAWHTVLLDRRLGNFVLLHEEYVAIVFPCMHVAGWPAHGEPILARAAGTGDPFL
jgi:hypothetical protein